MYRLTGDTDYLIKIMAKSIEEYDNFNQRIMIYREIIICTIAFAYKKLCSVKFLFFVISFKT